MGPLGSLKVGKDGKECEIHTTTMANQSNHTYHPVYAHLQIEQSLTVALSSILQGVEHPRCPRHCHSGNAEFMQCIRRVQTETHYETRKISSNQRCVLSPQIFCLVCMTLCFLLFVLMCFLCVGISNFAEPNANLRIEAISHETFEQSHRSLLFDNFADDEAHSDAFSHAHSSHSASNLVPSSESSEQVASESSVANAAGTEGSKNYDSLSSLGEAPCATSNSSQEVRSIYCYS